jgi:hypothetical protein
MYSRTMYCQTWDQLYEEFEEATLKRVRQPKNPFGLRDLEQQEQLNVEVTRTLHELRCHEQLHRCNG